METIGRVERIDLPDLGLLGLPAKIDTGAYSSSIHCIKQKVIDGVLHCTFEWDDAPHVVQITQFKTKRVRSSNGQVEERFLIRTTVRMGKQQFKADFTLTDRGSMKFPALLGRKMMTKRFLVDVSQKFMLK